MPIQMASIGRPTVGDERQRNARDRHDPEVHPDVLEALQGDPEHDSAGDQPTVGVAGRAARREPAPQHVPRSTSRTVAPTKPSSSPTTEKTKSVWS